MLKPKLLFAYFRRWVYLVFYGVWRGQRGLDYYGYYSGDYDQRVIVEIATEKNGEVMRTFYKKLTND